MPEPVTAFDLGRMFLGDYPPLFYAEVAVRIIIIYTYTLVLIRWIGARGIAQLSMIEFLLVIALGSAVGDSLFYEDVPILIAMWVITVVVVINKVLDIAIARSRRVEALVDGNPLELVRDGTLCCDEMGRRDLGADEVKAMLRREGIANLGEVRRAYLETTGGLSVFRRKAPRAGLAIVPPHDVTPPVPLRDAAAAPGGMACCALCGTLAPAAVVLGGACPNCGHGEWTAPATPGGDDNDDDDHHHHDQPPQDDPR